MRERLQARKYGLVYAAGGQAVYGTLSAKKTRGNGRRRRQLDAPVDGKGMGVSGSQFSFDRSRHEEDAESYQTRDSSVRTEPRHSGDDIMATIPMEMTMMAQPHGQVLSPGEVGRHVTKRAMSTPRDATDAREPSSTKRQLEAPVDVDEGGPVDGASGRRLPRSCLTGARSGVYTKSAVATDRSSELRQSQVWRPEH